MWDADRTRVFHEPELVPVPEVSETTVILGGRICEVES